MDPQPLALGDPQMPETASIVHVQRRLSTTCHPLLDMQMAGDIPAFPRMQAGAQADQCNPRLRPEACSSEAFQTKTEQDAGHGN